MKFTKYSCGSKNDAKISLQSFNFLSNYGNKFVLSTLFKDLSTTYCGTGIYNEHI